ncbi:MAG: hypothetical protein OQJ91_03595 [Motiliproteus sp.]|nr:hypothetical protein [Motiliproteus sp.]
MHRCTTSRYQGLIPLALAGCLLASPAMAEANTETELEVSGRVGYELRLFDNDALYSGQSDSANHSLFFEPEFYWEWSNGDDGVIFKPYIRADEHDSQRSHVDIRELLWVHVSDNYELKAGIGKVFWGVTEFQHLVDVINQTDSVEDVDGEDKLGQQMINVSLVRDWGVLDLFLLPGFRERTFAGENGRLRGPLVIDTNRARYQSSAEEKHLDAAIRWSHTFGDWDVGTYWFHGTNREPVLVQEGGVLVPLYEQMDQFGIDVQATIGDWLWKFETIYRESDNQEFVAVQGGFEYTYVGLMDTAMDLGLLMEYGWDSRGEDGSTAIQDDLFLGTRLTLNDIQSTEFLAGLGQDLDHGGSSFLVEASRRLGESWKLSVDARIYDSDDAVDPGFALRKDDMVQMTLERYF